MKLSKGKEYRINRGSQLVAIATFQRSTQCYWIFLRKGTQEQLEIFKDSDLDIAPVAPEDEATGDRIQLSLF